MGTFKILVHNGSNVIDSHFDNRIGTVVRWSGTIEPNYVTPPAVPAEVYANVQTLKQLGYEQTGISQLSAASQKPAGLNSGRALEEYHDIETDRFQTVGQQYERYFLELANLCVLEARELQEELTEEGKPLIFKVPGEEVPRHGRLVQGGHGGGSVLPPVLPNL